MSIHFIDIKHCVVCGKPAMAQEGAIKCCSKFLLSDKDDCEASLNRSVRDGLMKFCYMCGNEMIVEEDVIFCARCQDTKTFNAPPKMQLSDIQHCPLCARPARPIRNGVICTCVKDCNFRIVINEAKGAMDRLLEYATKGKIRYCYSCGSEANTCSDAHYVVCFRNDCDSCKLTLQQGSDVKELLSCKSQPDHLCLTRNGIRHCNNDITHLHMLAGNCTRNHVKEFNNCKKINKTVT